MFPGTRALKPACKVIEWSSAHAHSEQSRSSKTIVAAGSQKNELAADCETIFGISFVMACKVFVAQALRTNGLRANEVSL